MSNTKTTPAPVTVTVRICKAPGCTNPALTRNGRVGRYPKFCAAHKPSSAGATNGKVAPWRISDENIATACEALGITMPVYVKRSKGHNLLGAYKGIKSNRLAVPAKGDPTRLLHGVHASLPEDWEGHVITVSARLTDEQASRTIWHELTHAAQAERDPLFRKKYGREMKKAKCKSAVWGSAKAHARYEAIPYEVEARKNEGCHDTICALALPNKVAKMREWERHSRIVVVANGGTAYEWTDADSGAFTRGGLDRLTDDAAERIAAAQEAWDNGAAEALTLLENPPLPKQPVWTLVG